MIHVSVGRKKRVEVRRSWGVEGEGCEAVVRSRLVGSAKGGHEEGGQGEGGGKARGLYERPGELNEDLGEWDVQGRATGWGRSDTVVSKRCIGGGCA